MKRFWAATATTSSASGFQVLLDGKPLKLPSSAELTIAFAPLADAIAAEWAGVGENFTPDDLPLTRLATTAMERIRFSRVEIIERITEFGLHDLLCYRAAENSALAARESAVWQPWLDWAEQILGMRLKSTSGIIHIEQPPEIREAFIARLQTMSDDQLAGLGVIVPALGSLVLGLAVQAGALTPDAACDCAHLEEIFQEEHWGRDTDAFARRRMVAADIAVSARYMMLCQE